MFSNYIDFLNYFYSLQRSEIKLGLEHTIKLSEFVGNPHKKIKMIHVAGTNGKGSCSAFIDKILRMYGKKVGLYTSPHLVNFNERIRIDGKSITNDEIISFISRNRSFIEDIQSTFFEVSTIMAFDYFYKNNVDIAVIETGLGGRLDSTNIINPIVSIITSISFDHSDILGDSLSKIAKEKSGIIKYKRPVLTSKFDHQIKSIFNTKAVLENTFVSEIDDIKNIKQLKTGTKFEYKSENYHISMLGKHQTVNAALAIEAVKVFDEKIPKEVIEKGLLKTFWPGRIQKIIGNVYFDVAHNGESIKSLIKTIKFLFPKKLLFGMICLKGDKDIEIISKELFGTFKVLFTCHDSNKYLLRKEILSKKLQLFGVENKISISLSQGLRKIKQFSQNNGVGLIFGSHYIAEEIFNGYQISFDSMDI